MKWVSDNPKLCVPTIGPHCMFAGGSWCFPNSLLSELALECDSMLFPFQLKGSWGYKGIWLMGQNPVRFAENQMTAEGEGVQEGSVWSVVLRLHRGAFCITPSQGRPSGQARWPPARPSSEQQLQIGSAGAQRPVFRELLGTRGARNREVGREGASRLPALSGWLLTWHRQIKASGGPPWEAGKGGAPLLCRETLAAEQATWQTLTSTGGEWRTHESGQERRTLKPPWRSPPPPSQLQPGIN